MDSTYVAVAKNDDRLIFCIENMCWLCDLKKTSLPRKFPNFPVATLFLFVIKNVEEKFLLLLRLQKPLNHDLI